MKASLRLPVGHRVLRHLNEDRLVADVLHAIHADATREDATERHKCLRVVAELVEQTRLLRANARAIDAHAAVRATERRAEQRLESIHDTHVMGEEHQLARFARLLHRGVPQRVEAAVEPAVGGLEREDLEQTHALLRCLYARVVQAVAAAARRRASRFATVLFAVDVPAAVVMCALASRARDGQLDAELSEQRPVGVQLDGQRYEALCERRQRGEDLRLGSAHHHEPMQQQRQLRRQLASDVVADRVEALVLEVPLVLPEQAGAQQLHLVVHVEELVDRGRARQEQQRACRFEQLDQRHRLRRLVLLDLVGGQRVRLVEDGAIPFAPHQLPFELSRHLGADDKELRLRPRLVKRVVLIVDDVDVCRLDYATQPSLGLDRPPAPRHRRHNRHARPRVQCRHHAKRLQALAQPHLVGQHAPATHLEGLAHALLLVGAQLAPEPELLQPCFATARRMLVGAAPRGGV